MLIALYSGAWLFASHRLTVKVNDWIASEQSKGAKITPARISVGGYPFSLAIRLDQPNLHWPGGFGFSGQSVRLSARPWSFRHFKVAVRGGFSFDIPPGGVRPSLTVAGQTLRGNIGFGDEPLPLSFTVSADGVSASRTETAGSSATDLTVATLELSATRPRATPASDTDPALEFTLHLIDISSDGLSGNPLGGTIADANLQARLLGPLPTAPDSKGLTAWSEAGGTVDIPALAVHWGPLSIATNGTIALNAELQPEGAFTARIAGHEKAIDALSKAGWLKPNAAGIAKIALNLASKPGVDGQPTAEVPLTVQMGKIYLGPAVLGEMPRLLLE